MMRNPVYIAREDEHPDYYNDFEPAKESEVNEMIQERMAMIENALNWQAEGKRRTVSVTVGEVWSDDHFKIWCYDFDLIHGEHVEDGRVIDLVSGKKRSQLEQLEKLQKELAE